jgi:hypothetical protein
MQLGNHISLPEIPNLGLNAVDVDLPASDLRREVKIYKVPASVSADNYFISATEAGGVEEVPPSRAKDSLLLAQFTLGADRDVSVEFIHEELENA